jgi:UDP-2,3-diacylglucosamine pyrophosphatase LpxH
MAIGQLAVLSDTHISAGALDDCDAELQGHLCTFVAEIASGPTPVELVINGDFLDFVQAPPWEGPELSTETATGVPVCFTEEQSLAKLEAIVGAHRPVFTALADLLAADDANQVVILPGNHDADFFWPAVRSRMEELLCGSDPGKRARLRFHLEQVYRPPPCPDVWIEHGHQHDRCNAFFVQGVPCWSASCPPVLVGRDGRPRLYECAGTGFLLKYLNRLDEAYPFVDNVKPLSRFLTIFGNSAFLPGQGPFKAAVAVWGILRFLAGSARHPLSLLGLLEGAQARVQPLLVDLAVRMSPDQQASWLHQLRTAGFEAANRPLTFLASDPELSSRLMDFLADHPELVTVPEDESGDMLSLGGGAGELTLAVGFVVDETRELKKAARAALDTGGVRLVVMGHTHEVVTPTVRLPYVNTGCWTRYYRFADDEQVRRWPLLRSPSYERFPYQLNYVHVRPGVSDPQLVTYR